MDLEHLHHTNIDNLHQTKPSQLIVDETPIEAQSKGILENKFGTLKGLSTFSLAMIPVFTAVVVTSSLHTSNERATLLNSQTGTQNHSMITEFTKCWSGSAKEALGEHITMAQDVNYTDIKNMVQQGETIVEGSLKTSAPILFAATEVADKFISNCSSDSEYMQQLYKTTARALVITSGSGLLGTTFAIADQVMDAISQSIDPTPSTHNSEANQIAQNTRMTFSMDIDDFINQSQSSAVSFNQCALQAMRQRDTKEYECDPNNDQKLWM